MATQVRAPTVPIYLAGEFVEDGRPLEVHNPATDDLIAATFQAGADELERAVSIVVNDVPTWRIDHMPYGGVKDSGLGREGLRWSIDDMTEPRLLAFARPL